MSSNFQQNREKATTLKTGIIWNLFSLLFLAVAGIALNIQIGRSYDAETLGLFNIIFAVYILFSQLSTFGIHFSTLQEVSRCATSDFSKIPSVITSGIIASVGVNIIAIPLAFLVTPLIASGYSEVQYVEQAWLLAVPGLFFTTLNKVLLAAVNGLGQMRAFAIFQSARFIFILSMLTAIIVLDGPGWALSGILSGAEILLFPILFGYVRRKNGLLPFSSVSFAYILERLRFGSRVFLSGTLSELNTRVDVLMIGYFLTAEKVGVYTVAVLVFDAATQLIFVVRNNVNPKISTAIVSQKFDSILKLSRTIIYFLGSVFLVATILGWYLFPFIMPMVFSDPTFIDAKIPMIILVGCLIFSGGVLCFNMSLSQSNLPGWQSLYVLGVVAVNICANFVLIPLYGLVGAALGTAIASIFAALLTIIMTRKLVGLRILF